MVEYRTVRVDHAYEVRDTAEGKRDWFVTPSERLALVLNELTPEGWVAVGPPWYDASTMWVLVSRDHNKDNL